MTYMNKFLIYKILVILICYVNAVFFIENIYCKAEEGKVLILYDESKEYGSDKNLLNDLVKSELVKRKEINIAKLDLDEFKNLEQYEKICVLNIKNNNEQIMEVKEKLEPYSKNVRWFKKSSDVLNKDELMSIVEIYVYLDNVTPFNDLNSLISEINCLKNSGIKFFIEVSPVFINEDSNAMGKFAECLRYAEANGGKVILGFPTINITGTKEQRIKEKTKEAFESYVNYMVYPVGMAIDEALIYREDLKNILESTDTLFLNSKDNINIGINNYAIKSYHNIIQKISLDDFLNNKTKTITNNKNAITIDSNCKLDDFSNKIDKILKKEINLTQSSSLISYIKFNSEIITNLKGIFLNGKDVTIERFINKEEFESVFGKNDNKESHVEKDLTFTNRGLEIFSGSAIIIFLIILIISKNIERKRFFK